MKTFRTILLTLMVMSFLLLSFNNKPQSPSSQVVLHSNNLDKLTQQINLYYTKGYKVIFTESQSITTGDQTATYKGQVIIIMEKK